MSQHTPLPWTSDVIEDVQRGTAHIEIHGAEQPFATVCRVPLHDHESQANGDLILRAVNCHDELVAALEEALPELNWANCHGSRCDETIARVNAAIAKATTV